MLFSVITGNPVEMSCLSAKCLDCHLDGHRAAENPRREVHSDSSSVLTSSKHPAAPPNRPPLASAYRMRFLPE